MSDLQSSLGLAQKHPDQFLSHAVFPGLIVDEFRFEQGTSGNLGSNMISQPVIVPALTQTGSLRPLSGHKLAIHLNCIVTASALQHNTITITVDHFHVTARSLATQNTIDANGPSINTADKSIHTNVNTGWGRADNLLALAWDVEVGQPETLYAEISSKQGYNNAYMRLLVKAFRERVTQRIQLLLGGHVEVKWKGDKTFPTE